MIAKGELSCYKIYEDETHLAFLDIAPIRKGQTLVIPKETYSSKFSEVPVEVMANTMIAAQKVAKLLEEKLENVERCLLIVEGFDVDHFHVKLYPAYRQGEHQPLTPGGTQADKSELEKVQKQITG
jgi:diadenosine tetraphosphate (Ap4A) HIT family hydrolase